MEGLLSPQIYRVRTVKIHRRFKAPHFEHRQGPTDCFGRAALLSLTLDCQSEPHDAARSVLGGMIRKTAVNSDSFQVPGGSLASRGRGRPLA